MIYFRRFSGLYSIDLFAAIAGARRPDGQYSSVFYRVYWMVVLSMVVYTVYSIPVPYSYTVLFHRNSSLCKVQQFNPVLACA